MYDGETYNISVLASDLVNNAETDSVRVHIDSTGPEVDVWGLRGRWGTNGLYIHNSTDLSTMIMIVTAHDPHSGLHTIKWKLGSDPLANDVGQQSVAVQRWKNEVRLY